MGSWTRTAWIVCGCVAMAACAPRPPSEDATASDSTSASAQGNDARVVAVVGDESVTAGDFERRLSALAPYARARYGEPERRVELLESMVDFELLADEAERRGLGSDPAVIQATREAMVRLVVADEVRNSVSYGDITDEDVTSYIEEHADEFTRPEQRRALVIGAPDEQTARTWSEELRAIEGTRERFQATGAMARTRSTHSETRQNSGDFGWTESSTTTRRRPEIARAVFGLENVGDVSGPISGPNLWWVVVYADKRERKEADPRQLDRKIRERIYDERRKSARSTLVEKLRKKTKIETFPDELGDVKAPAGATRAVKATTFAPSTRDLNEGSR